MLQLIFPSFTLLNLLPSRRVLCPSTMGLTLESPISFDGSSAHDKATRRDSPHASSFSPFHAFKARRVSRRLSRQQSAKTTEITSASNCAAEAPRSGGVPAERSIFFALPLHLREHIYSLIISPGTTILHIVLKHHNQRDKRLIRFRSCCASAALDRPCCSAGCKAWLVTGTGTYRGAFDSIMNVLLVSKQIDSEVSRFL